MESLIVEATVTASIDRVDALERGCLSYAPAMPFKAPIGPLIKALGGYFSQPGMPKRHLPILSNP